MRLDLSLRCPAYVPNGGGAEVGAAAESVAVEGVEVNGSAAEDAVAVSSIVDWT